MTFIIKTSSHFDKHLNNIQKRFNLTESESYEIVDEIEAAVSLLRENGTLPPEYGYQLHKLVKKPWAGYMEFHVADDVLVVYLDLSKKNQIRLTGIYNHEMLRSGKID